MPRSDQPLSARAVRAVTPVAAGLTAGPRLRTARDIADRPMSLPHGGRGRRQIAPKEPVKAEDVPLDPGMSAAEAFRAVAHGCLDHFRANHAAFLASRQPEAIHQMRVALRRLRSALAIFEPMVADAEFNALLRATKRLFSALGEVRDLDVFVEGLANRPAVGNEPKGSLLRRAERARRAAHERLVARLSEGRAERHMRNVAGWLDHGPWTQDADPEAAAWREAPIRPLVTRILERRSRKVGKAARHLAGLSVEDRHRLRIRAKSLRYGCAFFGGLFDKPKPRKRHARYCEALTALQDGLGALNDRATAERIARRLSAIERSRATDDVGEGGDPDEAALIAATAKAARRWAKLRPFWD